jgi:hypothetical protein
VSLPDSLARNGAKANATGIVTPNADWQTTVFPVDAHSQVNLLQQQTSRHDIRLV